MKKQALEKSCPKCGRGPVWKVVRIIDGCGRDRFPYSCMFCSHRLSLFCKKSEVPEHILNGTPDKIYEQNKGKCERCGDYTYLEKHHWAPFKFFNDADKWPTSFLCRVCHEEWHQKVTGDLIKKKA